MMAIMIIIQTKDFYFVKLIHKLENLEKFDAQEWSFLQVWATKVIHV